MEKEKDKIATTLKISGFADPPEAITKILNLQPTETHEKGALAVIGHPHRTEERIYEENYWEYRVAEPGFISPQKNLEQFFQNILLPKQEVLRRLAPNCSVELAIAAYLYQRDSFCIALDNTLLQTLASFQAALDLDIYCLNVSINDKVAEEEVRYSTATVENKNLISLHIPQSPYTTDSLVQQLGLPYLPLAQLLNGAATALPPYLQATHAWAFSVYAETDTWIQKLADNFMETVLRPKADTFRALASDSPLQLSILLLSQDANPGFHFVADKISLLARGGAGLEIWCLSKD